MEALAGLNTTALVAAVGGLVAVLAIGLGARAFFGGRKDQVIERLERATGGGEFAESPLDRDRVAQKKFAGLANFLRPFAKLVKPTGGDDLSRLNRSLIHAGYRTENAVEIFLGIKFLLPIVVILILWQIDSHLEKPFELPPAISICFIGIAIAFFLPNLWLKSKALRVRPLSASALASGLPGYDYVELDLEVSPAIWSQDTHGVFPDWPGGGTGT